MADVGRRSAWIAGTVGIVVGVLGLAAVVLWVDPDEALASLLQVDPRSVLAASSLYVLLWFARARRAWLLLPEGVPFRGVLPLIAVGFFLGGLAPTRFGLLIRPLLLQRRLGVPFGAALAGALLERAVDVVLLLLVVAGLALDAREGWTSALLALAAVGALVALATVGTVGPTRIRRHAPAEGPIRRLAEALAGFLEGFSVLAQSPRRAAAVAGWSLWMWCLGLTAVALVLDGVPGTTTTLAVAAGFHAAVLGAMAAVPTPSGFGAWEAAGTATLVAHGVDPAVAAAAALAAHLVTFGTNLLLALVGATFLPKPHEAER